MSPAPKDPDVNTYLGRFAKRLRTLRQEAGFTVPEAVDRINRFNKSDRAGATIKKVYDWESAKSTPHLELFPAIAKALKVTIHELLPEK